MSDEPIKEIEKVTSLGRMGVSVPGQKGTGSPIKPGWAGGPGRPKGSRNKVRADLAQMILNGAARAGYKVVDEKTGRFIPGDDGCDGYLLWVALHDHKTYCMLLSRILPYYLKPDIRGAACASTGVDGVDMQGADAAVAHLV